MGQRAPKGDELTEAMEAILTAHLEGRGASAMELAKRMGLSLGEVEGLLRRGQEEGLIALEGGQYKLTEKGIEAVREHRVQFVHERYGHGRGPLGYLRRLLEGDVEDLPSHLQAKHEIDRRSIEEISSTRGAIEDALPLSELKEGESAIVLYPLGGFGLRRRLIEMGLTPGAEITVLRRAPFRGPIEVGVRGTSLALGFGVASKVIVKRLGA
ncbi:MAG: FeoA domain-containing protein [Candidatus Bathyarchaeia archaeon]